MKFIFLILVPFWLFAEPFLPVATSDILLTPQKESGYFQGWNVYFHNKEFFISINYVVSNIGPGDLNNGINIVIAETGKRQIVMEREFSKNELSYAKDRFKIQMLDNFLEKKDGKFYVNAIGKDKAEDIHLYLIYEPANQGVQISNGNVKLNNAGAFLRANVPFTDAKVYGVIVRNGIKTNLHGRGNMEHLITNLEVYKYSNNWFVSNSYTSDGNSIVTGGFNGNKNYPDKFFKTVSVISPSGRILFSGKALKNSQIQNTELKDIAYTILSEERLEFDATGECFLHVSQVKPFAKINILARLSLLLRKFIQVFFAKPYQIYSSVKTELQCGKLKFQGTGKHSYFLINPDR